MVPKPDDDLFIEPASDEDVVYGDYNSTEIYEHICPKPIQGVSPPRSSPRQHFTPSTSSKLLLGDLLLLVMGLPNIH
ncbi:unnamed protein product [Nippostrongylus brasiliensis]|uniref:Reverse transcriptase domain-containing protein n=1 Tax=Nippostrongylus brasiliensis TaxID=27835 RepID=A0A0N4XTQ5_NIPBR|nr:unnamed protein product [Nippostrongylus brasiliensis]